MQANATICLLFYPLAVMYAGAHVLLRHHHYMCESHLLGIDWNLIDKTTLCNCALVGRSTS